MGFLRDLFAGPGNAHWDLGRILGTIAVLPMIGGALWNVSLGLPLELGPTGLGGGIAAVVGSVAALIYAKDKANPANQVPKVAVAGDLKAENVESVEVKK